MKSKPVVGQRMFVVNVGNSARYAPQVATPVTVTAVGRKYFTVKREDLDYWSTDFHIDSWRERTDFSPNYDIYATEQEWADKKESMELWKLIQHAFSTYTPSLPLETLRKIKALLP